MSPEQAAGRTIDHRADLYAAGLVFYEMLTGRHVFPEGTLMQILLAHQTTPAPRVSLSREVPEALDGLIARCLSKLPEDRPASAAVIKAELSSIAGALAKPPEPPELPELPRATPPKPAVRVVLSRAGTAALMALAAGLGVAHFLRETRSGEAVAAVAPADDHRVPIPEPVPAIVETPVVQIIIEPAPAQVTPRIRVKAVPAEHAPVVPIGPDETRDPFRSSTPR
jgi:serine/threonine-protein kinase